MTTTAKPGASRAAAKTSRRVVSPELVGRERELELLLDAVAHPPAVAVIEGEAGIGKSRLVGELAARLQRGGRDVATCRVLVGRCHRVREPFPLGPVLEAVRELGDVLGHLRLSPLVGALVPLLPELAHVLPPALDPLGDSAAERHRVFRALAEVLDAVAPAVLIFDDAHWIDEVSAEFLRFVVDRQPASLTVAVSYRGDEVDGELAGTLTRPPAGTTAVRLELSPLNTDDTARLSASLLDVDSVTEEFAAYLHDRTDGLPFAVEEVLALLRDRRDLIREDGRWVRSALDELSVPKALADAVLERVARLPSPGPGLIEAVAVLGAAMPEHVVAAVGQADADAAVQGLSAAIDAGLLDGHDGTVGFRHALAAQAVYEAIPQPRLRVLHSRAAGALQTVQPRPLGLIAHHLRLADRLAEWAQAAKTAADQAIALGHDGEAVRLLEDVLRTVPLPGEQRGRLAVKLGQAAVETLRSADVVDVLSQSLEHEMSAPMRGELALRLAIALEQAGQDPARQRALFAQAAEDLRDRPDLRAHAMVALGIPKTGGVSQAECREWLDRALTVIPEIADPAFRVFILGKVTMILVSIGAREWRPLAERIEESTGGVARHAREVNAYWSVGAEACYLGHHAIAHRLLSYALAGAISCRSRRHELFARSGLALCQFRRGAWQEAADGIEDLLTSLDVWPLLRIDVEVVAGGLATARGDTITGRRRLSSAMAEAERLRAPDQLALPAAGLARLDLITGELDSAVTTVKRCVNLLEQEGEWASTPPIIPPAVEALTRAGDVREARSILDRCAQHWDGLDAPLAPAALRHAEGFLATDASDWTAAGEHLDDAADLYEQLECPYEAAQAREQAASAMFETDDPRAEQTLRAALATYQHLGAIWDHARCSQLGRARGVSLPVPHRRGRKGYGRMLSPREAEVARLAAHGYTNQEIGEQLFLSPRTVSKHVSSAMRKTGVHSRQALIRVDLTEPHPPS